MIQKMCSYNLRLLGNYWCYPNWIFFMCLLAIFMSLFVNLLFFSTYIFSSILDYMLFIYFYFFPFLGPHPRHMEVPRLGVVSELQLLAYTTTRAMPDPSHICNLHHCLQQCWILNPLSETRDRTSNLMVPSWICFCCTTTRILGYMLFYYSN